MMRPILFLAWLAGVQAHTIFQKVSVNGVDQGYTFGVRDPDSNSPIQDVNDPNFACNSNIAHKDNNLIQIPQGASVGTYWDTQVGGSAPGSTDEFVAASHKGPIQAYLAAVSDATAGDGTGLQWFKVAAEGLSNGAWAVDNMRAANGWWTFTMPSCVTAGQYLMRMELLALHGASSQGGAQFYQECAQIQVTGSGTSTPSTVSFPGAYSATDPGILISIYDGNGSPYLGGAAYPIPGPEVLDCASSGSSASSSSSSGSGSGASISSAEMPSSAAPSAAPSMTSSASDTEMPSVIAPTATTFMTSVSASASGDGYATTSAAAGGTLSPQPTTMMTSVRPSVSRGGKAHGTTTASAAGEEPSGPASSSGNSSETGSLEQCGGEGWTGPTQCSSGSCKVVNQWFSQCLPDGVPF